MNNEPANRKNLVIQNLEELYSNPNLRHDWGGDEIVSDGSANAFSGTESFGDDEDDFTRIEDK